MADPNSFAQAIFWSARETFLRHFEQYLVSSATPVDSRRTDALETEDQISAIVDRLKAMRVI